MDPSPPSDAVAILVECDPDNSLGGSCLRDIRTMLALCGIYRDYDFERRFKNGDYFLTDKFKSVNCTVLTTHPVDIDYFPEGVKMGNSSDLISILEELSKIKPKTLLILLTGHGYQRRDTSGDEKDGRDEYIRVDNGVILDDDLLEALDKFNSETDIIALSDTCHSGTLFDFPKTLSPDLIWIGDSESEFKGVHLSACTDSQLSQCDIGDISGFGGSLTVALSENMNLFRSLLAEPSDLNLFPLIYQLKKRLLKLNQTLVCQRSIK